MPTAAVPIRHIALRRVLPMAVPVLLGSLLLVAMHLLAPAFFRPNNLMNVLVQTSSLGIMAIGMTFVMLGGGIDLSVPAVMAFAAVVGAFVMPVAGVAAGLATMLAVGCAIGAFNGAAVALFGMTSFVVTLATMTVIGGATVWLTNSKSLSDFPDAFFNLMLARPVGVPVSVILLLAATAVAGVVVAATRFGRSLYAVGLNARAARVARVRVRTVLFATYVISGGLAGVTAAMLTARLGSASATLGNDGVVLDIVTACVIGGVSIYGGVGRPVGAVLGALLVTLISNSLNQLDVSYFMNLVVKGIAIVVFILLDRLKSRAAA